MDLVDQDIEILTDPESGMMYEKPVYVQDPQTGIYRVKTSNSRAPSSQKESQASSDEMINVWKNKKAHQKQPYSGVNHPLSRYFASNPMMVQCPIPLP